MKLTIFYDSGCPLCMAEMRELNRLNHAKHLIFEDIHAQEFVKRFPHIDRQKANDILHGELETGELLLGLDVTHRAWALVGKHQWIAILRWPVIRQIADWFYLRFAKHRYRISYWLTGQPRCERCETKGLGGQGEIDDDATK